MAYRNCDVIWLLVTVMAISKALSNEQRIFLLLIPFKVTLT